MPPNKEKPLAASGTVSGSFWFFLLINKIGLCWGVSSPSFVPSKPSSLPSLECEFYFPREWRTGAHRDEGPGRGQEAGIGAGAGDKGQEDRRQGNRGQEQDDREIKGLAGGNTPHRDSCVGQNLSTPQGANKSLVGMAWEAQLSLCPASSVAWLLLLLCTGYR